MPQGHNNSSSNRSDALPSIGTALIGWDQKKVSRPIGQVQRKREAKLGLWTSVALQHHFTLSAGTVSTADELAGIADQMPPEQPHGRLTLAQKMGLVPPPPPPPTEDDWRAVETRATLRQQLEPCSNQRCSICCDAFYATADDGQVILSCSHVFHERCFKQFERFTRAQQRLERNASTNISKLACPECRATHYHKRTYFAGKALAQRAAIVRIQSAIRSFLARRLLTRRKLEINPEFRQEYIQKRLEKLSKAWDRYVIQQERDREAILESLDAQRQAAQAAFLTESEWQLIADQRRAFNDDGTTTSGRGEERGCCDSCPICLEGVEQRRASGKRGNSTSVSQASEEEGSSSPLSHEEIIANFRRQFDEKQQQKKREKQELALAMGSGSASPKKMNATMAPSPVKPRDGTKGGGGGGRVVKFKEVDRHAGGSANTNSNKGTKKKGKVSLPAVSTTSSQSNDKQSASSVVVTPPPQSVTSVGSLASDQASSGVRRGVILSCGHIFHDTCLRTFERYTEWRFTKYGGEAAQRCPVCRSGYQKHAF